MAYQFVDCSLDGLQPRVLISQAIVYGLQESHCLGSTHEQYFMDFITLEACTRNNCEVRSCQTALSDSD